MSFEGYYQKLCANGHLINVDVYQEEAEENFVCPKCGEKIVWSNLVNETNGSFDIEDNRIDGYVELEIISKDVCKECGHIKEIRYKIPETKEGRK